LLAVPESGKLILTGQYQVGCFFWQQHLLFISTFFGKSLAEQTNKQETIISFLLDVSKPQNSASMLSEKKKKPRFHLEQGLNLLCVIKKWRPDIGKDRPPGLEKAYQKVIKVSLKRQSRDSLQSLAVLGRRICSVRRCSQRQAAEWAYQSFPEYNRTKSLWRPKYACIQCVRGKRRR
jgi:hypothetical protein